MHGRQHSFWLGTVPSYRLEDADVRCGMCRLCPGLWVCWHGYIVLKNSKRVGGTAMCQLFAHQPQRDYESQTRSLRIDGHCTSIRLEMAFWDTLEEIAAKEAMTLAKFLTTLHNEVLDHHGEVNNFASLLRCSCLIYRSRSATAAVSEPPAAAAAILDAAE